MRRLALLFVMVVGMVMLGGMGDVSAQRLPRGHFRVTVDATHDDYRVRVGRGVSVRQLLEFANRQRPVDQPPITRDDFIAENRRLGDALDQDGTGNLVYVCGHTAHRRRTYSRNPDHWASCPDARRSLKLIAHHEWYWLPRRHRPGPIETLGADVRTAVAQSEAAPIQWMQLAQWVRRWLQLASPAYQPGYAALAAAHGDMLQAADRVQPVIRPPPASEPVVTPPVPVPSRARPASPAPTPEPPGWTLPQLMTVLVLMVLCFVLGLLRREPRVQELRRTMEGARANYDAIIEGFNGQFIRPSHVQTAPGDVIEAVAWSRRVLGAYAQHCLPFEDKDATEVMNGVRIERIVSALKHRADLMLLGAAQGVRMDTEGFALFLRERAALLKLTEEYGVVLTPETLRDLLVHAQYEVYDPNVLDQRDTENRAFREATTALLGEGHDTPDHLRAYVATQQPSSPRDPMREKTPLMNPLVYPGDHVHALQSQVAALEASMENQRASIPPGVRAAAVLATRILPMMRMVSQDMATAGNDLVEEARRIHAQEQALHGKRYAHFADAVEGYVGSVRTLMILDERVLALLEDADRWALANFAKYAKSKPPPMLAALMEEILKRRGQTPPPRPMPAMASAPAPAPHDVLEWEGVMDDVSLEADLPDAVSRPAFPPPPAIPTEMRGVAGHAPDLRWSEPPQEPFTHTPSAPAQLPFPPGYKPPGTITIKPPVRPTLELAAPPDGDPKKTS